ncbi:hypothetical protein KIH39_19415 [Telmatocola sphagniphila]|uniref:Uncharacterized protein n=1 Tax=Telmatocola sphagniphila TaxID=1123043 RepID=A0A8E6B307_9BACT|nr:hypothetical protein [Telmatocola sphagniphila]QVL31003.1 hypothetical protein KIH39_19415 [Telmatocola sphagniphila]
MSRYAYLVCEETKHVIWLGKIYNAEAIGRYFQIGAGVRNSENPLLMKAVMKFLAEHLGKTVSILPEEEYDSILDETFIDIGGDGPPGISLEAYIEDFAG